MHSIVVKRCLLLKTMQVRGLVVSTKLLKGKITLIEFPFRGVVVVTGTHVLALTEKIGTYQNILFCRIVPQF